MLRIPAVLSLTLLCASLNAAPVVPNPSFEDGGNDLVGWSFGNGEDGQGKWEWDTARVHSGKRALKMVKFNAVGYSMLSSDFIAVEPGKDYEVRAWISVAGRARGNVYFMITQHTADSADQRLPNTFSVPQPFSTGEGWQLLKVKVSVREGNTRLRINALINQAPVTVIWDDFEVGPTVIEKYSPRYEKPVPEALPPLEPAQKRLVARQKAVAMRQVIAGRARFVIDGKLTPPCFYVGPFHNPQDAQIADFRKAGVRVYLMPLILGRGVYGDKGPWLAAGKYDFKEVDDILWRALRVDPDGYIIFYMATDPYREWGAEHPTEVCADQFGQKSVVYMHPKDWGREPGPAERYAPSLVSSVLRQETAETLRALIRHVNASLPGKAVIGYHVAGLNDGQFFQWAGIGPDKQMHLADYSEASRRAFRDWVRRQYGGDVAALRRAWSRPDITFDTVEIPSGERRMAPGFLLDAPRDQDIADYNRFYSAGTVETIHGYARVIKEETRGQALVSTYWEDACANVDSHLATGEMLRSPDIDFLAGPAAYGVRMPGEVGECHSTWGSVGLHDRIYLTEQDWRSWLSGPLDADQDHDVGRAESAEAHNAMVRRECGMMLAFGQGTWWYDMCGGWFRDDGIMKGIAEARAAFASDLKLGGKPRADVAVFIDERSLDYLAYPMAGAYRYEGIVRQLFSLNQSGVPYHLYLQSDLPSKVLPEYKLYLFLNPQHVSAAEAAAMKALRRGGKTLAFVHAPGVIGAADQAASVSDLTGIKVSKLPGDIRLTASVAPTAGALNPGDLLCQSGLTGPGFAVEDEKAFAVGTYPGGKTAVAARDFGTWKSVFFGPIGLSETFFNRLAHWAGAWVVAEPGDAVYASQHFVTIHALWDGEKTLTLLRPSRVTDLTSGKVIAERAQQVKVTMKRGETRWFGVKAGD